jgi:ABC-type uncharacterized transport system substrate-binding protein
MNRRSLITLLGGAAAWPVAARAKANKVARIGFLGGESAFESASRVEGFRVGLRDVGYVEGTNLVITYRWAEGDCERLPGLAAELVRSGVDVIVTGGTPGSLAAKQATVDKIIKGTPPADIPIEQATKFDFVVNLKSAKWLGVDVPPILVVRADEVIE